jgi:riboflavin kinase
MRVIDDILGKTVTEVLVLLAKEGAYRPGGVRISLNWLVDRLSVSRQTASRRLIELEEKGLIKRELGPRGQRIWITQAGLQRLRIIHDDLRAIFGVRPRVLKLIGHVVSGLGEGSYYMRQEGYREQFKRVLGFEPYLGTLDLKLAGESLEAKGMFESLQGKRVESFRTHERTFGPVKCFQAKLRGVRAAIVLPARSTHTDIIELAAPKNLRKALKLNDGDTVEVEVLI